RPAVHEQVDDVPGLAREVRLLGRERVGRVGVQEVGEGQGPEADTGANEKVAAREHGSESPGATEPGSGSGYQTRRQVGIGGHETAGMVLAGSRAVKRQTPEKCAEFRRPPVGMCTVAV